MTRILVVDDEPLAAERLARLCGEIDGAEVVGLAADGDAALVGIAELDPDLLLLDISMPGLDGMALARILAGRSRRPAIVFVTAHDRFAIEAFELAATDYLLKPVSLARLRLALDRSGAPPARASAGPAVPINSLWVPRGRDMVRLPVDALDLMEAERDYVRLYADGRTHLIRITLQELQRRLDPVRFVRVHRSAIVAVDRIDTVKGDPGGAWTIHLLTGQAIRVGRSFRPSLRRLVAGMA